MSFLSTTYNILLQDVIMLETYAPWIALAAGIIGIMAGYFLGYRTGRTEAELAMLKATRGRRDHSRSVRQSKSNPVIDTPDASPTPKPVAPMGQHH